MERCIRVFEEIERLPERKIINIKTLRIENDKMYSLYFSEKWNVRSYLSEIDFSSPIIDFKGNKNNKLTLKTTWFNFQRPYWNTSIDDENGFTLGDIKNFGKLNEHFNSYSQDRLIKWQGRALSEHRKALNQLEDLFYQGNKIPEIS